MKRNCALFLLLLLSTFAHGQIDLKQNGLKLFSDIKSDTLYDKSENIIQINLQDFPSQNAYSYRCEGGIITLKRVDVVTIGTYAPTALLKVFMREPPNSAGVLPEPVLIGQKKFFSKPVTNPSFFQKTTTSYTKIKNNDVLTDLDIPLYLFPSIEFRENYYFDSKYVVENLTIKVKRNNTVVFDKTFSTTLESIVLQDLLKTVKLETNDVVELKVNKFYRENYIHQQFYNSYAVKVFVRIDNK